jgi:peptidoglycan/LPS O-acetylase OafA/YrhL
VATLPRETPLTAALPGAAATAEDVRSEVGYLPAIEGLRGIAVLWVVVFHYVALRSGGFADPLVQWIDTTSAPRVIVRQGFLGVDLFFLITGFLLTLPWFKHAMQGRGLPSARGFYIRRARRILPAYYVQLAMLFFVFLPLLNPTLWRAARGFVLGNLALHLLFLHYSTPYSSASLSINGPLWTLALEMQYYLLLPLIAVLFLRAPFIAAAVFLAASLTWKTLALHDLQPLISLYSAIGARWQVSEADVRQFAGTQLPAYLGHFALGILCGRAWLTRRAKVPGRKTAALLGALAACAVLGLYEILAGHAARLGEHGWVLIPVLMATVIWAAVSRHPPWGEKLLGFAPLTYVGRVSYSMYLYHLPVLLLFNKYAPAALAGLTFPCYLTVMVAMSAASFQFIERPFMRSPNRFALPEPVPSPPVT